MMYYVVGEGGAKYGPADVDTLKQWATENRLTAAMMLEDAATGAQIPAGQVPGLFPPAPTQTIQQPMAPGMGQGPSQPSSPYQSPTAPGSPYQAPTQQQNPYSPPGSNPYSQNPYQAPATYPRGASGSTGNSNTIVTAWIMFALGVACCFLFSPAAIFFGKKAKDEGHPQGNLVMILGIIWTCLGGCGFVFGMIGIFSGGSTGGF
jgi:hypothetical protein